MRRERLHRVVRLLAFRVKLVEHVRLTRSGFRLRDRDAARLKGSRSSRPRDRREHKKPDGANRCRQNRAAAGWNAHRSNGNVRRVQPPVRVSGIGVVSVFGTTHAAFRDALLEGRSGIVSLRGFDTAGLRSTLAGEIAGFDPSPWVPPMKMRRMD